jgi:hypothetical protein
MIIGWTPLGAEWRSSGFLERLLADEPGRISVAARKESTAGKDLL